ncbi:MAG: hypothetical protein RLY93_05240 [Sumerlaeia bacterium]
MFSRISWIALLCVALTALAGAAEPESAPAAPSLAERLETAVRSSDDARIEKVHQDVLAAAEREANQYEWRILAAKGYLARADLLRVQRQMGKVSEEENSAMREQQAIWGKAGAEHAEAAKRLATTDQEKSEAYRLSGECTVHRINGPFAGMRYGPTAKSDIEYALEKNPENWEAHRAQGLMFLNNPPINGGDLDKALETFSECAENDGDRDAYHALLAQTWMKKDRPERARLEVQKALAGNPDNLLARLTKERLEERKAW